MGLLFHKPRESNKKSRSIVWNTFNEIFSSESNEKIEYYYFCIECEAIVHNPNQDGNTNRLLRHICTEEDAKGIKSVKIKSVDVEKLKIAAAGFIAKDLRPYFSVECEGLRDFGFACMLIGQKYHNACRNDFIKAMPSRNTVKGTIGDMAKETRESIGALLKLAIASGGIAATTDTWTDNYRHTTYICVVAHICLAQNDAIMYHRYVLNTSEIAEIVKTGKYLKIFQILK